MRELRHPRGTAIEDQEGGFTLVEMMVVMLVLGMALGLTFNAVVRVQRYTSDVSSTADAVSEARQALAQVDRIVRSGDVFYKPDSEAAALGCTGSTSSSTASGVTTTTSTGTCLTVYSQSNGTPRCYQWQLTSTGAVAGTKLLRTRSWSPSWSTNGDYTGWSTVARNMSPSPSSDPFSVQSVSPKTMGDLLQVRLDAYDQRRKASAPITASEFGRNTVYGYDAGSCSVGPSA